MSTFKDFHNTNIAFLESIAPGEPGSDVYLGKNLFPRPISWCKPFKKWDKGRLWSLIRHKALFKTEEVFNEPLKRIFYDMPLSGLGKNNPNRENKHIAIAVTDYSNARLLIFKNDPTEEYFEDDPALRIFEYYEKAPAYKVIQASCAIPGVFSAVRNVYQTGEPKWDKAMFGDGAFAAYLPSSYLAESSNTVQIAISCTDLKLPRTTAFSGIGKFKWNGIMSIIENLGNQLCINSANSDMLAFYASGNKYYHTFLYSDVKSADLNVVSFDQLTKKVVKDSYLLGVEKGKHIINELTEEDKRNAHEYGITLALSGGGTLFPALFGCIAGIAEQADKLESIERNEKGEVVDRQRIPATIKAMIGASASALAIGYMAEYLPK